MLSWLISQQALLCILFAALIIAEHYALKALSARFIYGLWLLLPALLLVQSIELKNTVAAPAMIGQYVVTPLRQASAEISISWELAYWLIAAALFALVAYQHLVFQRRLNAAPLDNQLPGQAGNATLYHSKAISSPMVVGFFNPRIVMPQRLLQDVDASALTLMLEHEQVHLERRDNVINLIALSAAILIWFNPLGWVAYFSLRRIQELACDERVLADKSAAQRLQYGKSMVKCASQSRLHSLAYAYYGDKNMMLQRLYNMQSANKGYVLAKVLALLITLGSFTLVAGTGAGEGHKQKSASQPKPVMRIEPIYPKEAAEQKISGSVVLRFQVDEEGTVRNVVVVQSQPAKVFDKEAVRALQQWRYEPYAFPQEEHLVQLDFALSADVQLPDLTERINVKSH
ncbi:M56 family metallopeptidase [Pseudoalteromonas sp. YIC-827]|uniref:Protein TonB n=1 Tax=Pseudoalteromonas qingdaonensis TaxID=3131913 RepID=A0ABU9MWH5_9GAMM